MVRQKIPYNQNECKQCFDSRNNVKIGVREYSIENDMDPRIDETLNLFKLPKLNDIEELFISRVHVVMKACRLAKVSVGHEGNVMKLELDMQPLINKLPFIAADLPVLIVRKLADSNNSNVYKDFKVNKKNTWT